MNKIGLEFVNHPSALHFWKIQGQADLIVERKGKALGVLDLEAKGRLGEFGWWSLTVDRQDIHMIACLVHKLEHFLESVGISRNMSKGGWFHHETNFSRRIAFEWRRRIVIPGLSQ